MSDQEKETPVTRQEFEELKLRVGELATTVDGFEDKLRDNSATANAALTLAIQKPQA